ncbi:hypothetical protein, partial [Novosphingobium resinovorum]|uniref:hypothetical protein n=2 Tax=Sphingomonadaceae TaxID=41297 RepID=UPI003D27B794
VARQVVGTSSAVGILRWAFPLDSGDAFREILGHQHHDLLPILPPTTPDSDRASRLRFGVYLVSLRPIGIVDRLPRIAAFDKDRMGHGAGQAGPEIA